LLDRSIAGKGQIVMGYYPIFLEMKDRRCVVIGGGAVAERKVEGLVAVGANVTVISPVITDGLRDLLTQGAIRHVAREYQASDRAGYDLVFVATDNSEINAAVFSEARSLRIWVNSADDPDHCDFILPAVIRRGDLTVAVSTGGASPAVTRAIREELDEYFTADYARFIQIAGEVRRELREKSVSPPASAWNRALQGDFRRLIKEGRPVQAKELLLETLGAKS
jgi:precorrin-2 dehydrogenase/sirohydrochlorin ferrochelatase